VVAQADARALARASNETNHVGNVAPTTQANPYGLPPVTVVIPTRDRGDRVLGTLRSILAGSLAPARVIVADQSKDGSTEAALAPFEADRQVQCVRTTTTGISAALNDGIAQAETELIAITGDDCDVACTWLEELARELAANPATGIVFGTVRPGRDAVDARFTPSYVVSKRATARSMFAKHRVAGTSACMALRKSVWAELGGFDEMLGVGSPLRSAEEVDLTLRALLAGFEVCETPMAEVVHHGDFAHEERGQLIGRNWYGTGAAFAKP
jgi:GT2 family glycosyltransferase